MSKTYSGFGVVQPDTARQSPLGQKAQLRDDGLVDLFGRVPIVLVARPELVLRTSFGPSLFLRASGIDTGGNTSRRGLANTH